MLGALSGINLMYMGYFEELQTATRLLYHGILSLSMILAFSAGLSVRIRRFRKRFHPLLERIRRFRQLSS
jgi:hypothetical protein